MFIEYSLKKDKHRISQQDKRSIMGMMDHIHWMKTDSDSGASTEQIYNTELMLRDMWQEAILQFELECDKENWG